MAVPEAFQRCRQSAYRTRLSELGVPPDGRTKERIEFAKFAYSKIMEMEPKAKMPDPQAYFDSLMDFARGLGRMTAHDPFFNDLVGGNGFPDGRTLAKKWFDNFEKHGFIFFPNRGLNCGIVLSAPEVLGVRHYLSALVHNESVTNSAWVDSRGISIIDTATMLEDAVFKINAYRFGELEPVSSMLLTADEGGGPYERAKEAYDRRLGMLFDRAGRPDRDGAARVMGQVARERTEPGWNMAGAQVAVASWGARAASSSHAEDEAAHTINLLNSLVCTAMISYGISAFLRGSGPAGAAVLRSPFSVPLSALAGIAFGNTFDKLGSIQTANLAGRPDMVLNRYLGQMAYIMGYERGQGAKKANLFMLTRNESDFRNAAGALLNGELGEHVGRRLSDAEMEGFARAGKMSVLAPDDLPKIAGVWKEAAGRPGQD